MIKKIGLTILFLSFFILIFLYPLSKPAFAAKCNETKPDHAPDLFQIDVTKNSATLYFTPVNNAVTNYTIVYGYARGEERFGVSFPFGRYDGVINYTVNHLSPNMRYYFKVRADNGCRNGYWSDTMSVRTNWEHKIYTKVKNNSADTNFSNEIPDIPNKKIVDSMAVLEVASPEVTIKPSPAVAAEVLGEKTMFSPTPITLVSKITTNKAVLVIIILIFIVLVFGFIKTKSRQQS